MMTSKIQKVQRATLAMAVLAISGVSSAALADGVIQVGTGVLASPNPAPSQPAVIPPSVGVTTPPAAGGSQCGPHDPDCRKALLRLLGGAVHFAQASIDGGVRFGGSAVDGAVRFTATGVSVNAVMGDLNAVVFEAMYVPDAGGVRIRITAADSDVVFFCKDPDTGTVYAPLVHLTGPCQPDAAWGLSGKLLQFQDDPQTGRSAMRWAEANVVYNFLQNGNSIDFLNHQLMAYLGADVETFFSNGGDPNDASAAGTRVRMNLGVMGMLRTNDNRFEINGYVGYRPNVVAWDDYAIEARTQLVYHLLLGGQSVDPATGRTVQNYHVADIGLEGSYTHWSVPARSFDPMASDSAPDSLYVGAMFKLTWF